MRHCQASCLLVMVGTLVSNLFDFMSPPMWVVFLCPIPLTINTVIHNCLTTITLKKLIYYGVGDILVFTPGDKLSLTATLEGKSLATM